MTWRWISGRPYRVQQGIVAAGRADELPHERVAAGEPRPRLHVIKLVARLHHHVVAQVVFESKV